MCRGGRAGDAAAADAVAAKLAALPEVSQVVSLSTFLPTDQDAKLALIKQAREQLAPVFDAKRSTAADDAATVKSIDAVLGMLKIAEEQGAPEPVLHFQSALQALKAATPAKRAPSRAPARRNGPRSSEKACR